MANAVNYIRTNAGQALGVVRDAFRPENIRAKITASKVAGVVVAALAIDTMSKMPGADAGPITAWVTFAGCVAATIWVPWFMVECPEVALIAAALPTP